MKVSILVILTVLPMLASIGLYSYAFISTRWSYIDEDLIRSHNSIPNHNNQLEKKSIRHAFRSHYGLFGYCLDYKWLNLLTIKSEPVLKTNSTLTCQQCNESSCPETGCCMKMCDNIPDCPSYKDENACNRPYNQTRYYWPKGNCMWQSTWIGNQGIPRYLSPYSTSERDFHNYKKQIRYYLMFFLFLLAPLLTLMGLLMIFCINCIERFYSIPFAFVSFLSLTSFLSGATGLGIFLYEWTQERLHRPDFTYEVNQTEPFIVAFNPWLINAERLGLAFWLIVAAISTNLFITILSCCFCCGLQSEKSKLRINVKNKKYEIVHMSPYDE